VSAGFTEAEESFHPPTVDDYWWSETHMFNFDLPGGSLSGHIYPYFRKNAGVAQLQVWVWDRTAQAPWLARYGRSFWHLPFPDTDLRELRLGGLELDCIEPFRTIDVRYRDGDRIDLELRYEALREPHFPLRTPDGGHFDQPCHVRGRVVLDGEPIEVDTLAMRDKSWGLRPDHTRNMGGAYSWGTISGDDTFLAISRGTSNETRERHATHSPEGRRQQAGKVPGYLVRDGRKELIRTIARKVVRRSGGAPQAVELEIVDEADRSLALTGRCVASLANQSFPGAFTWLTTTEWETADGEAYLGQDQEYWSPDLLGPPLAELDT
jgi:hypothetical protein